MGRPTDGGERGDRHASIPEGAIERALGAELTHRLGYAQRGGEARAYDEHHNATQRKTVLTDGPVAIEVPRDREGSFEPHLIGRHERRFRGLDDKVIALHAQA